MEVETDIFFIFPPQRRRSKVFQHAGRFPRGKYSVRCAGEEEGGGGRDDAAPRIVHPVEPNETPAETSAAQEIVVKEYRDSG